MSGFITNVDDIEEKTDDIVLNNLEIDDISEIEDNIEANKHHTETEDRINYEIKELEKELEENKENNEFSKEEEVLKILKEDFQNLL